MDRIDLKSAAVKTIECLGLGKGERLGIPCNPSTRGIANAIAWAARSADARADVLEFPEATRHGEEPPDFVAQSLLAVDAVVAPTVWSISHTKARIGATERGVRVASMPGITDDIFTRAVVVDFDDLKRRGDRLAAFLTEASACRVRTESGTDVTLSLEGREGRNDDGDLRTSGAFGNLPAGEAYIAPVEDSGDGIIVFDGSLAGLGLLEEPLRVWLENGRVVHAEGAGGSMLLAMLDAGGESGRHVAEFGIGTNVNARLQGAILEDEKVSGTIHIAFGTSAGIGGVNISTVHIDGLVISPDVALDAREVMVRGKLTI